MSSIPEESIIGGVPAKFISTGFRRVENSLFNKEIHQFFHHNPNAKSYPLPESIEHSNCDSDDGF